MCRHCEYIPYNEFKEHLDHQCPFRKSAYCSFCAVYGHPESDCPAPPPDHVREPRYLEQLLPTHLVQSYNINTATPINFKPEMPARNNVIELINHPDAIKRYLLSVIGGIPSKAREDDMRRTLDEYARKHNKLVVFSPVPSE
jgi:hypothetical protein